MAKILDMPKLSPTMEEGQLASWHKKEGDAVDVDDLLAEVETDKATMEFRSFDKGTILKLLVPAGSVVRLGQPVAILGNPGEDVSALVAQASGEGAPRAAAPPAAAPPPAPAPPAATRAPAQAAPAAPAAPRAPAQAAPAPSRTPAAPSAEAAAPPPDGRVKASPYVRKLAREQGLDLHGVEGSGPAGRVVARDLADLKARPAAPAATNGTNGAAAPTEPAPAAPRAGVAPRPAPAPGLRPPEAKPLSMMRKTIARRLTESKQTVPHFYLTIDVDAEPLVALRETVNRELAKGAKGEPEKVSVNDLLVKACAIALRREPACNAQYTPDAILYHARVDVSVAVSVAEGLLTPVVRDADLKSVVAIGREVRDLAARARDKKLAPEEMADGTFSISNLGMFGIDEFAAVINPPEGAILAVGRVRDEPVVRDGAVAPGKRLAMTLSCDHRVVDGAVGARFLAELRRLVEQPMQILVG
jgi:pyruvate dehydrogenase E2 component (dihydrolipoamide acetyltransferase)